MTMLPPLPAVATAPSTRPPSRTIAPTSPGGPRYIIDGILPKREVSILSGASGAGKTTLIVQLLAAIVAGEDSWFGHHINHPVRIAYVAADRTWESYAELAERAALDTSRLQVRSLVDDESIDVTRLERDSMQLLHGLIGSFDSPDLIVVDPMVVFLGVDPNKYNSVAPRLIQMGRWCKAGGYTILATHHATKARTDYSFKRPQDRISGSSALLGFTSSQLFLSAADEIGKPYSEFAAVNHNAPPEAIKLMRDERGMFAKFEDLTVSKPLAEAVVATLSATRSTPRAALQAATRIDPATLDHILDWLTAEAVIRQGPKGEWRLRAPIVAH